MCGIVGIYNFSGPASNLNTSLLSAMRDTMRHRGPDDEGLFLDPNGQLGFGFRRLSIIDLSPAGHQPMTTEDGRYTIVFNGEIYNHRSFRTTLASSGVRFRSQSDTETLLYGLSRFGEAFISQMYGMFALALWDQVTESLLLVRDRIGIKPLYYTIQNGAAIFASEIKALLRHPAIVKTPNFQAISDYLSLLSSPPETTLFEGIHKVPPGHCLSISKDGAIHLRRYWSASHSTISYDESALHSLPCAVDTLRSLLRDSISLRMMSDVPFGVFLSGGIDSSLNVALMSELMSRPVDTFTVGFKDLEKYNELHYARQIASHFKTNHHEVLITERDAIDFVDHMLWLHDEPNADPVSIPLFFVSKLARERGTIVVQVGEGSDESFAGYAQFYREWLFYQYYHSLFPRTLKHSVFSLSRRVFPESLVTEYLRRSAVNAYPFYGGALGFSDLQKESLITNRPFLSVSRFSEATLSSPPSSLPYYSNLLRHELVHRLPELLLMRVDKMSMGASIEARVPFLDHRITEFAYRLPDHLKVSQGESKYILKKAAEGILPTEIIYRKKQGFAAPIVEWLRRGEFSNLVYEEVMSSPLLISSFSSVPLFSKHAISSLFQRHRLGKARLHYQLWSLFLLNRWFKHHFL